MKNRGGQVTIFIIIGILLVVGVLLFFIFRGSLTTQQIPQEFQPIYNNFLQCLGEDGEIGIKLLESQAGYLELPEFEPGSDYAPFSNQLDFLGTPVPYWYYVSGNGIQREQIPQKGSMEKDLENFIKSKIYSCDYDSYYEQGYGIDFEEPNVDVKINEDNVVINLDFDLGLQRGDSSFTVKEHEVVIDSQLGSLYDSAKEVYKKEQETLFLEEYAVDTLNLYAPVDGVDFTCSPLLWGADEIFTNLTEAIEVNTNALKVEGGDYNLKNKENEYFVTDISSEHGVRFINSRNWPRSFEVNPSDGNLLISEPVGNQPGLGILGFCYVAYHFVYNVNYPVLIQVYDGDEIFQFPVAVVLRGNNPREPLSASSVNLEYVDLCEYKTSEISVKTYDINLNPVEAEISYRCLGTTCDIGSTGLTSGMTGFFPQCVNGFVVAEADGYLDSEIMFSSVNGGSLELILDKIYDLDVDLRLDGQTTRKNALIYFVSDKVSKTVVYPEQKSVELAEGDYDVSVYVYDDVSLEFGSSNITQCVDVPRGGLLGLVGLTEEQCFDVEVDEDLITRALAGGGKQERYLTESGLSTSNSIVIDAEKLPTPDSLEQIQQNYDLFENNVLEVYLM